MRTCRSKRAPCGNGYQAALLILSCFCSCCIWEKAATFVQCFQLPIITRDGHLTRNWKAGKKVTVFNNNGYVASTAFFTLSMNLPRREILGGAVGAAAFFGNMNNINKKKANAVVPEVAQPLADLPMVRVKLPKGVGFGREYVVIKVKINGEGPFEFMIDSGLTTELVTPNLTKELGLDKKRKGSRTISGLAAGGGTARNPIIDLEGTSLCCGKFSTEGGLSLPGLHAVITDFPQEHIDPAHDPIEGMLGMEVLSRFDVDFDFPRGRIRFWEKGTADHSGLIEIPAVVINETGLLGIRVSVPARDGKQQQPILGFLDCGSSFSCINWVGANALGFAPKGDPSYNKQPSIGAVGVDGRMIQLPLTKKQTLTFAGDVVDMTDPRTGNSMKGFAPPPPSWKDWEGVQVAIGDIPAFSTILGDGITPYQGPAALIGLDILSQRRIILEAGDGNSRRRRVFVSPK